MRTTFLASLLAVPLALAGTVRASVVDDICAPPGTPQGTKPCACTASPLKCRVTKMATVTSPSTLDFGTRTLEMAQGAKIDAGVGGRLTVIAAVVDLQGGSGLLAAGGNIIVQTTTGNVSIRKSGTSVARIDVAGDNSGSIDINSAGDVLMEGLLDASTTIEDQFAGDITVEGRNVVAPGEVDIHGALADQAGTLSIDTTQPPPAVGGNIVLTGKVDASSGDSFSASVDLLADGDIDCRATIDLRATKDGGVGGALSLDAGGSVTLGGTVRTTGAASSEEIGDAGPVDVNAIGSIILNGVLDLSGPQGGSSGDATFGAGLDIVQTGSLDVSGHGIEGFAAEASFSADRAITLGNILATGGENGSGGLIDATAQCDLKVPAGKTLDARGPDGSIVLASGGTMTVDGTLRATSGNELDYRSTPPVVHGTLDPPLPGSVQVPGLIPCGGNPPAGCGDNSVNQPNEKCDGTDDAACPGKCSPTCHCQECGNGTIDPGEACDDGNKTDCDGCKGDCTRRDDVCGDHIPECGEEADDGNNDACDGVSSDCMLEGCGNGVRECGEECDDGEAGSLTCSAPPECKRIAPPGCGNGTPDDGEACDDGNTTDCDGCSHLCQFDGCGSGTIDASCGETCDDLNTTSGDGCSSTCQVEECGNGVQDAGEECDAGAQNGQPNAGCSVNCTREFCGNGTAEAGEECDTGADNGKLGTPCSVECKLHWCGNGVVDPGELCDLGAQNGAPGSGCRPDICRPGSLCTAPAAAGCIPCADSFDCDPLRACGTSVCTAGVCTPVAPPSCDDGNPCTTDSCDPATGCVHTPLACEDATACDGTMSCNPGSGQCVNGPAPDCDDRDACTDDSCAETPPTTTCRNQLRPGLEGATCRLTGLQSLIDSAPDIPKATRKKLKKQAKAIARKLPVAAGVGKKAMKARMQVSNALKGLTKTIAKAQGKLSQDTVNRLRTAITNTTSAVAGL